MRGAGTHQAGRGARRGREEGAPRGAGLRRRPAGAGSRLPRLSCRLGMASSPSHTHTLTHTHTHTHTHTYTHSHARALALSIGRPARGGEKLPRSVNHRTVGEGAGDTGRPSQADWRVALPVSERAGPPQPWCFHHAREGKEGRADGGSGRGRGGGSSRRRGPGGRAGVSPNFDNFPPLARPAPPGPAHPRPARPRLAPPSGRRPRRRPNPGAGGFAAGLEPAAGAA